MPFERNADVNDRRSIWKPARVHLNTSNLFTRRDGCISKIRGPVVPRIKQKFATGALLEAERLALIREELLFIVRFSLEMDLGGGRRHLESGDKNRIHGSLRINDSSRINDSLLE